MDEDDFWYEMDHAGKLTARDADTMPTLAAAVVVVFFAAYFAWSEALSN